MLLVGICNQCANPPNSISGADVCCDVDVDLHGGV